MVRIAFTKMEGAGNDYIYVDAIRQREFPIEQAEELARLWSARHFGVGSDGLIVLLPSHVADVRMAMWNADGSSGSMCGNGLRCIAVLAAANGHVAQRQCAVETSVGVRTVELWERDGADVEIGEVRVDAQPRTIRVADREVRYFAGDAGNPHAVVVLAEDPESYQVGRVGALMQRHDAFADGINVEFVQVQADGSLRQRTYERGSGETLACGSGAATAALVALEQGLVPGPDVVVHLRGGSLTVRRRGPALVIGGPARTVFCGEIELPEPAGR